MSHVAEKKLYIHIIIYIYCDFGPEQGCVDCLDLLLSNGANFRLVDNDNRLALHHAASQGHYPCIFTLVGFGSDTNAQDINGATPLHLAAAASYELVFLLSLTSLCTLVLIILIA